MNIENKLEQIVERFEEITNQMSDPAIYDDAQKYAEISKEHSDLSELVEDYKTYKKLKSDISGNKELIEADPGSELAEMAQMEVKEMEDELDELEEKIKYKLVPKDPDDRKNAILEIRAGTGGDEAAIFAGDLFDMYRRYADSQKWKVEVMHINEGSKGGYKEIVLMLSGDEIFGKLKFESGVHRVQRVPDTETQGRVHTSAATVAVLPEVEEVDVQINPSDLEFEAYRASGAGGQHVNTTDSAVRIKHVPSGVVVTCQEERSQHKNREKALKMLRAKLYETELEQKEKERAEHRKSQVSTGDRSAKIRTYNFPQGRMTDHRINLTLYNLDAVMKGEIEEIIEALRVQENLEKLQEMAE